MKNKISEDFFSNVYDLNSFRYREFNLINLFYSRYLKNRRGKSRRPSRSGVETISLLLKWPFHFAIFLIRLLSYLSPRKKSRILFMGNSGRHSYIGGKAYDLYNARIIEQCDSKEFVVVEEIRDGVRDRFQPEFYYKEDLKIIIQLLRFLFQIFNKDELKSYSKTILSKNPALSFSENEVKRIVSHYFATYALLKIFLSVVRPSRVLLICHYGHEPFIAACKSLNIHVIELMHGTISESHPQYNFPQEFRKIVGDKLFPDKLAVYGEYWKDIVVRGNLFQAEDVDIVGYYLKTPKMNISSNLSDKNVILITSQWTVVEVIRDYVIFLKENLDRNLWQVVIKPHPVEDPFIYTDLLERDFIVLSEFDIYSALLLADIHISVYSSVLYEAVRYNVSNYVLRVEEYRNEYQPLIDNGIALPLNIDQLPVCSTESNISADFFFAEFNPTVLFK